MNFIEFIIFNMRNFFEFIFYLQVIYLFIFIFIFFSNSSFFQNFLFSLLLKYCKSDVNLIRNNSPRIEVNIARAKCDVSFPGSEANASTGFSLTLTRGVFTDQ